MEAVKKNFLKEKIDRWTTAFAAITSIPVLGVIIKMVFDKVTETGAKKLQQRIEKILGFTLEEAKKDVSDEILYGIAVNQFTDPQQLEMDKFEQDLRLGNKGKDKEKAEALVLFVAKTIKTFERKIDDNALTCQNIEDGLKHAKKFLEALLKNKGANPEETFDLRVKFLEGKNVFSLIKEKKNPSLNEALKKAKKGVKKAGKKVEANYSEGIDSLNNNLGDFLAKAKAWRDRA